MRIVVCMDCARRLVLRRNIRRSIRRHFVNEHGPELAPGVFARVENPWVRFVDRRSKERGYVFAVREGLVPRAIGNRGA